ncbi:hypothetical protein LWI28_004310 [Acer negundo]|uniref:Uncharacterized protein n=1 Tax=Acer negundo TaxID=4023 RepID=A0AAD5NPM2_ACENE|nr:hypothetical protein LWI28_004310 [Acer negundo]
MHAKSQPVPQWTQAVNDEVLNNPKMQDVAQKIHDKEAVGPWRISDGIIFFKEKVYLGDDSELIPIIEQFHGSTHEGIQFQVRLERRSSVNHIVTDHSYFSNLSSFYRPQSLAPCHRSS